MKTLFLPCTIFLSPVPSHLPKTHTTSNIPPPTHTVLSSLDVSVHDSLAANPLVGWMNVYSPFIIRLIRHLTTFFTSASSHTDNWWPSRTFYPSPLPPPTSSTKSFSCHFSFFSLPSALLALHARLKMCILCTHSHPPTFSSFLPAHTDFLLPTRSLSPALPSSLTLSTSLSIYLSLSCALLGPEWHLRADRKKAP